MGGVNWAAESLVAAELPDLVEGPYPAVPEPAIPDSAFPDAAALEPGIPYSAGPGTGERLLGAFVDGSEHAAGLVDVIGAAAASLAVIAILLIVGRTLLGAAALHPLRMMGSMSLTAYVAHVVSFPVIMVAGMVFSAVADVERETWLVASTIAATVFAVAWKRRHRRGPLEEVMHHATERAARFDVPAAGAGAGTS